MYPNVSPAYARDYCDWIARGSFKQVYERTVSGISQALSQENPAPIGAHLEFFATCFYERGAVDLLNDKAGWHDLQCGFMAAVYSLKYELKAFTLPAWNWNRTRTLSLKTKTELVMTLGLARLFRQTAEIHWLEAMIYDHFDIDKAVGTVKSGRLLLESILNPNKKFTFHELVKDRKECCQKRDAWPERPTEITPFGVIDIESILRFPGEATFSYPDSAVFAPTPDEWIEKAIIHYHVNFE